MASRARVTAREINDVRKAGSSTWRDAVKQVDRSVPDDVAERIGKFLDGVFRDHVGMLPPCVEAASLEALEQASFAVLPMNANPPLALIERLAAAGPDDDLYAFQILNRFEPIRPRSKRLTDDEKRFVLYKFRLFRIFEHYILAEFFLDDIAGYLIPSDGNIRSRVCLVALKALLAEAVRRGRRKPEFIALERSTHRVDSQCWEIRPAEMKGDEVDEAEMAFRKLFTIRDGNKADVQEIEQAIKYLYILRQNQVLVEKPPPYKPPPPRERTLVVTCLNPDCLSRLRVPARFAGRRGKCPKCGEMFEIPAS